MVFVRTAPASATRDAPEFLDIHVQEVGRADVL
jgi:hypothetical protein